MKPTCLLSKQFTIFWLSFTVYLILTYLIWDNMTTSCSSSNSCITRYVHCMIL
ncbi:hypothetical protein X975_09700, partial [Stegodyphus mimosarum]